MTALDQAFIKAYTQPGRASAPPVRPVPLEEALDDDPRQASAGPPDDARPKVSVDGVLQALSQTPPGIVQAAARQHPAREPETAPAEEDRPTAAAGPPADVRDTLPLFVREGAAESDAEHGETALRPDDHGRPSAVHRIDHTTHSASTAPSDGHVVPAPHLEPASRATVEIADEMDHDADEMDHDTDQPDHDTDQPDHDAVEPDHDTEEIDHDTEEIDHDAADADARADPGISDQDQPCADGAAGAFQPMLQVDHYTWPKVCRRLSGAAAGELDRMTDRLTALVAEGRKTLGIGGCRGGEGTTTLLLCAGRRLADRGCKVVMVDAHFADPRLGKRLGLLPQFGWEEVLAGRLPLQEVAIESTRNQLAVLPLREPFAGTGGPSEDQFRLVDTFEVLAESYDVVLVDLGPLEDPDVVGGALARGIGSQLDVILLVQDVRTTTDDQLADVQGCLAAAGIAQPGTIQNFVSA